jgi:hypothetical protein
VGVWPGSAAGAGEPGAEGGDGDGAGADAGQRDADLGHGGAGDTALFFLYPQKTRAWFNTVNGQSAVAGSPQPTRAVADIRFNQLGGIYNYGVASQQLNDWSDNWFGHDANAALPACMDRNVAANSVPAVSVSSSSAGCPAGQYR